MEAARLMVSVADKYRGNNNFEYDLVDILRQAIAEKGRLALNVISAAYEAEDKALFGMASQSFLNLILLQDELLGTRKEFRVGNWTDMARRIGKTQEEKDLYEWNARVQITTWGNRAVADQGKLRDYAHKEWNGILKDFYYKRWKMFLDGLAGSLNGTPAPKWDWYAIEEPWTKVSNTYTGQPEGDCIEVAKRVYTTIWH
jgi:alpha-N-acetylglucosaminidase